jgi:type VI secretion system protein ImpJ
MRFPAVHWHEGLFLQPHHFQAWDRHWTERIGVGESWQNPFSYGVYEVVWNHAALAAGFLQIDVLRCKTQGATLVEFSEQRPAERRDLRPAFHALGGEHRSIDVFVGVARLQLGSHNVDDPKHRNGARFHSELLEYPDETDAANVQPVGLRRINAKILFGHEDLAGYDVLRIGKIRRSEKEQSIAELDTEYVPPLMDIAAWAPFRQQVLQPLCDLVHQQSEKIGSEVEQAGGLLHANTPVELQRVIALQALYPAVATLSVLSRSRGIHPMHAYLELARVVGSLQLLRSDRQPPRMAAYDHEDIGPLFASLKRSIFQTIEAFAETPYLQYCFHGTEHGMQLSVDRGVFTQVKRWLIGVQKGTMSTADAITLISPANLDWKLGSTQQVDALFLRRGAGLQLRHTNSIPASLPRGEQWIYFDIVNQNDGVWDDVVATGGLSMRIRETSIVNRSALVGSKTIVLRRGDENVPLQFSLFGVRS